MSESIEIKCILEDGAVPPEYKTTEAAGADVCAFLKEPFVLEVNQFAAIPTGIYFEIPKGFEIQVRPRSGLAINYGITCLNAPGTIDSDYRGEVKVILINHGNAPFVINNGDRIAQLVVAPVIRGDFIPSDTISVTSRDKGGFGSTRISG